MNLDLSFDERMKMAAENPAAFEDYRKKLLTAAIERSSPHTRKRLRGMQFRIDMERQLSRTPMASCIKLYSLMLDYFYNEHIPVINMQEPEKQDNKAAVIRFPE